MSGLDQTTCVPCRGAASLPLTPEQMKPLLAARSEVARRRSRRHPAHRADVHVPRLRRRDALPPCASASWPSRAAPSRPPRRVGQGARRDVDPQDPWSPPQRLRARGRDGSAVRHGGRLSLDASRGRVPPSALRPPVRPVCIRRPRPLRFGSRLARAARTPQKRRHVDPDRVAGAQLRRRARPEGREPHDRVGRHRRTARPQTARSRRRWSRSSRGCASRRAGACRCSVWTRRDGYAAPRAARRVSSSRRPSRRT